MGCEIKGNTIICSRGPQQRCACGRPCTKLCDFIVSSPQQITHKKTCDKPMCDRCAVHVGPELDYCKPHADIMRQREKGEAA